MGKVRAVAGWAYPVPRERWWQRHRREYWVETEILREGGEWETVILPLRCIRSRFLRRLEALRMNPSDADRAIPTDRTQSS